jgi:hypothetical protein
MPTPKQPGRKRLEIVAEPGWIDLVAAAAEAADRSLSSYVRQALKAQMERDGLRPPGVAVKPRGRPAQDPDSARREAKAARDRGPTGHSSEKDPRRDWPNVDQDRIAVLWGAWAAIDGYRLVCNPARPKVTRPTDKQLVEAAANGTFDGPLFERFCKEYEVFRYPINVREGRDQRLQKIAGILARWGKRMATTPDELAKTWWGAITEVQELLSEELKKKNKLKKKPPLLRSMCIKALWFYRPDYATMWDSYAVKGINRWRGRPLARNIKAEGDAAAFLREFEMLYREREAEIKRALDSIRQLPGGMRYPYDRRVLDKALWFMGADEVEQQSLLEVLEADPERGPWLRGQL